MTDAASALVLFSGGQDSTTCLAWALDRHRRVETVGFAYGQRHAIELDVRDGLRESLRALRPDWSTRLGRDIVLDLSLLGAVSHSALTADIPSGMRADGLPNTFVPGRNIVFLTFAAIIASQRGLKHVVTGVCETDYSGYPDCRDDTMKSLQATLNLGMAERLVIETPLMWVDKAGTWAMAERLGGPALVEIIRRDTHSCYAGDREHDHAWGRGCAACDACRLRAAGWATWVRGGAPPLP